MSKEEDFYPSRSELISSLILFIKLSDENCRDVREELNEALWEAQDELKIKDDDKFQLD